MTTRSIEREMTLSYRYAVHFTRDLFAASNGLLRSVITGDGEELPRRILFVIDAGVESAHPDLPERIERYCREHADTLALAGPPLIVPGGEESKNDPRHVERVHRAIDEQGICRHSYVAAIGGGAVLDMVGYAAATGHRGVRLIRIPTTVLSQNDSGVGVKNGINSFGKKNFLGCFAPPRAVLNDLEFLSTLDDRDWRSGIAEAVKVALIKDAGFFTHLEQNTRALAGREVVAMERLVYRCAELHLDHIATCGDPFELGSSRPLDFGHWAAHKLESLSRHRLRHGEAVAIGIALDVTYSQLAGYISTEEWYRIIRLLLRLGFRLYAPELGARPIDRDDPSSIASGLREFREHLGGTLTLLLLRGVGRPFEVHDIDDWIIARSIEILSRIDPGIEEDSCARPEKILQVPSLNHYAGDTSWLIPTVAQ